MRDSTRPPLPRLLRADLVVMTEPWRCMVTGEVDHPIAFALSSTVHPALPPLLISAAAVEQTMQRGLREIAESIDRNRPAA
jgi:hypothetical protein